MLFSIFFSLAAIFSRASAACDSIEVRKEWRALNTTEQADWIDAVKCMANLPHNDSLVSTVGDFAAAVANITTNSSYYDDYAYVHSDLNPVIHFTGLFFPFHRYFVWSYTQVLKTSCGYTGVAPYWNWTIDSSDVLDGTIWSDDSTYGLGQARGDYSEDCSLTTGAFTNFTLAYPCSHELRRNFTLQPYAAFTNDSFFTNPLIDANSTFTPEKIDAMIANYTGDYKGFQKAMEGFEGPHGSVHEILGGDLAGYCPEDASEGCFESEPSPTFSANEPMFWMHHAMVDHVWWLWQNAHPNNTYAYEGGSVQSLDSLELYEEYPNGSPPWLSLDSVLPTDGILLNEGTKLSDVWITEGDLLCYTYE